MKWFSRWIPALAVSAALLLGGCATWEGVQSDATSLNPKATACPYCGTALSPDAVVCYKCKRDLKQY